MRDNEHQKLDAILARMHARLVDRAMTRAEELSARFDDANWSESEHPRDPDGKFASGAGGGSALHGFKAYKASLKNPKSKGSALAMVEYMAKAGTYGKGDIAKAAIGGYGIGAGVANHYVNHFTKKGYGIPVASNPPIKAPIPSEVKAAEAPAELENFQIATSLSPEPEAPKAKAKPANAGEAGKIVAKSLPAVTNTATQKEMEQLIENLDKLTPENSVKVLEAIYKLHEVAEAGYKAEDVDKLSPVTGAGMSVNAVNSVIASVKKSMGTPIKPYTPTTAAQKTSYSKFSKVPHYKQDHTSYFENASGAEHKAVLKTDTKKIPGDFYAKISSAYAGNKHDGNTSAVSSAMDTYKDHMHSVYTAEEHHALSAYKDGEYGAMNKTMLGHEEYASAHIKKNIEELNNAMKKSVVPADTPVYRGLNTSLKNLTGFDDPEDAVGRCFEHTNFASVSRDKGVSSAFGTKTMLKFTIPAGSPGIVLGNQYGEKEIVLPPRSVFRVDKVEENMVYVTYLGVTSDE